MRNKLKSKFIIVLFIVSFDPVWVLAENLYLYPFGDSITKGWSIDPNKFGYRDHLQDYLKNHYDFVGAYKLPASDPNYDVDHGGVSGQRTDELKNRLGVGLSVYMSKVNGSNSAILIHAGTNDIHQDYGSGTQEEKLDSYVANVKDMIDIVHTYNSNIQVFIALIIPINSDRDSIVKLYNTKLSTMLSDYGKTNLYTVDIYTALIHVANWRTALMGDTLHPNDSGYRVMAAEWARAINNKLLFY